MGKTNTAERKKLLPDNFARDLKDDTVGKTEISQVVFSSNQSNHIDLSGLRHQGSLVFRDVIFDAEQTAFDGAHIEGSIVFRNCQFNGTVSFWGINCDGRLFFEDETHVKGDIILTGCDIGRDLCLSRSTVEGSLQVQTAVIGQTLRIEDSKIGLSAVIDPKDHRRIRDGEQYRSVWTSGTQIGGSLEIDDSKLEGFLRGRSLQVAGEVIIQGAKTSIGINHKNESLDFRGANIGADFEVLEGHIKGAISARSLRLGGSFACHVNNQPIGRDDFGDSIYLYGARIEGKVELDSVHLLGGIMAQSIQVEGSFCCRKEKCGDVEPRIGLNLKGESVRLTAAMIQGDIDFDGAHISGRFRCRRARCGKNLRLENAQFPFKTLDEKRDDNDLVAEVDLYESEIEGTLHLNGLRVPFICLERTHVGKIFWEDLGPVERRKRGEITSRIPSFDLTECQYQNINVDALSEENLPLQGRRSFEEEGRRSFDAVRGSIVAGVDLFPEFKVHRTERWQFKTIWVPVLVGILFGAFFWGQLLDHFGALNALFGIPWLLGVILFTVAVFPVFWSNPACEHRCLKQCAEARFLKLHVRGKSSPFEEGVYRTMEKWLRERGREDSADFVYLLMRRLELERIDKDSPYLTPAVKRLFLHVLGYGIDIQRILFIYLLPVLLAFALFIPADSVEWHPELGDKPVDEQVDTWGFPHGPMSMTLRTAIPMVSHQVWYKVVPSQEGMMIKTPWRQIDLKSIGLTIDLVADLLVILSWVLLSFLIITVSGVLRERRV